MERYTHSNGTLPPVTPKPPAYELTRDPLFYSTVVFFTLLTTIVPGIMGQPNLMPALQALGLTVFSGIALRRGGVMAGVKMATLWLVAQAFFFLLLVWLLPLQAETTIHDGFIYRAGMIEWIYAGGTVPGSLQAAPLAHLGEIIGVVLGSLASVGLVGGWFLVKGVNLFSYGLGSLWRDIGTPFGILLGLAPWRLAQLAGYTGLFTLLMQPLLLNNWNPAHYLSTQRRLILISLALVIGGTIAELFLPGLWRTLFSPV